jgi:hypothetical protein
MNRPRSTEPRPLFKHDVIGSCRTYSSKIKQQPQAAITYNELQLPAGRILTTRFNTKMRNLFTNENSDEAENPALRVGAVSGSLLSGKVILDACCGSRMFWFDKTNPNVLFADIRNENHILCDGRALNIEPDLQMDFRNMPFADNSFKMVVFDPPHLNHLGQGSWMGKKYGILNKSWKEDIKQGFQECMRVLEPFGILIFKWNEDQIKVSEILSAIGQQPLFGHKSGKSAKTHWMSFMKAVSCNDR